MNAPSAEQAYLFRHALLREAAYELQPPTQRAALHAICLQLLSTLAQARPELAGAMALELADHAHAASLPGSEHAANRDDLAKAEALWLSIAADYAHQKADYRGAAATWRRLLACPNLDDARRSDTLLHLATTELGLGNAATAESVATIALDLGKHRGDDSTQGAALNLVARAQEAQGRSEQALQSHLPAVAALRRAASGPLPLALAGLASCLRQLGRNSEGWPCIEEAVELIAAQATSKDQGPVLAVRAQFLADEGKNDTAVVAYEALIAKLDARGARAASAMARANMGFALSALGRLDQAHAVGLAALQDARAVGALHAQTVVLNQLGGVALERKRLEEALSWFQQCLQTARESDYRAYLTTALNNNALTLDHLGRLPEAEALQRQALELARQSGNRRAEGSSLANLASTLLDQDKLAEAEDCVRQSIAIQIEINNPRYHASALTTLCRLQARRGDLDSACASLRQAAELFQQSGDTANATSTLADLNKLQGTMP